MTATFTADAVFLAELCGLLAERIDKAVYPIQVPATVTPTVPYVLAYPVGGSWDRGLLEQAHRAGTFSVQFTSVGKGIDIDGRADFLWIAGAIRAALDAGDLAGTGWKMLAVASEGPPLNVQSSGPLLDVVETYAIYATSVDVTG